MDEQQSMTTRVVCPRRVLAHRLRVFALAQRHVGQLDMHVATLRRATCSQRHQAYRHMVRVQTDLAYMVRRHTWLARMRRLEDGATIMHQVAPLLPYTTALLELLACSEPSDFVTDDAGRNVLHVVAQQRYGDAIFIWRLRELMGSATFEGLLQERDMAGCTPADYLASARRGFKLDDHI